MLYVKGRESLLEIEWTWKLPDGGCVILRKLFILFHLLQNRDNN